MKAQNFVFPTADKHDRWSRCVIWRIYQSGHFEIESVRNRFRNAVFALADRWTEVLLARFFDAFFDKDLVIAPARGASPYPMHFRGPNTSSDKRCDD